MHGHRAWTPSPGIMHGIVPGHHAQPSRIDTIPGHHAWASCMDTIPGHHATGQTLKKGNCCFDAFSAALQQPAASKQQFPFFSEAR